MASFTALEVFVFKGFGPGWLVFLMTELLQNQMKEVLFVLVVPWRSCSQISECLEEFLHLFLEENIPIF